jgi:hypothetical protein
MGKYLPYLAMAPFLIFVGTLISYKLHGTIKEIGFLNTLFGLIGFFLIVSCIVLFAWGAAMAFRL